MKSRCAALGHGNRHSRAPNGRLGCYDCFHAGLIPHVSLLCSVSRCKWDQRSINISNVIHKKAYNNQAANPYRTGYDLVFCQFI